MREMLCPICSCGPLIESKIYGYECPECGEIFAYAEDNSLQIVEFDVWKGQYDIWVKQRLLTTGGKKMNYMIGSVG